MAPRVDSPTNIETNIEPAMDEEEDIVENSSLTSRPLRRVPTPMGQSHTTGNATSTAHVAEDSLFDKAEKSDKSPPGSKSAPSEGTFFGADFETLSRLKNKANSAATRGHQSLKELVYGPTLPGSRVSPRKKDDSSQSSGSSSRAMSLFHSLAKPFIACSSDFPRELDEAMGDIVANAATAVVRKSPSDDYSRNYSYDDDYDEARQLRRMTSWNTLETTTTAMSYLTDGTDAPTQTLFDDDGNPIPHILVDLTKEMRQKRSGRRKRVVKFDYPPISSLKECPRPDPDDLPNLYFTEDELNQIEDDRASTTVADDVEVVCVSASESTESSSPPPPYESRPLREMGEVDESDTSSLLHQNENRQAAQQKQRRYRGRSPAASRSKKLFGRGSHSNNRQDPTTPSSLPPKHPMSPQAHHNHRGNTSSPDPLDDTASEQSRSPTPATPPDSSRRRRSKSTGSKRLIKSVHIFMRERSRERSAEI